MSTAHTPLPWKTEFHEEHRRNPIRVVDKDDGDLTYVNCCGDISRAEAEANAEFIVRACNNHAALLEACEAAVKSGQLPPNGPTLKIVLAAIAKATGGNS